MEGVPDIEEVYKNQLKMMEMRLCTITDKHREKLNEKNINNIRKEKTHISHLNGKYKRRDQIFKVFYILNRKKEEKQSEESNSKLIKDIVESNIKKEYIEYILITNIDPKSIKILKKVEYSRIISVFSFEEMYIFAPNHYLVPIHTPIYYTENLLITDKEIEEMQEIPSTDIIARILGLKKGNLVIVSVHNPVPCISNQYNVIKLIT